MDKYTQRIFDKSVRRMQGSYARYTQCDFLMSCNHEKPPDSVVIQEELQSMFDEYGIKVESLHINMFDGNADFCFVKIEFSPINLEALLDIPIEIKNAGKCCDVM
jgi:hypothetical protein